MDGRKRSSSTDANAQTPTIALRGDDVVVLVIARWTAVVRKKRREEAKKKRARGYLGNSARTSEGG
jgi:hypothetical protein